MLDSCEDNISKKLSKMKITNPSEIINTIFGKKNGTARIAGLLDAANEEEFEEKWKILADNWNKKR